MEKKKGMIQEFKEFIMRGNVLDMAVGVIIAGAFGKITASLVNDILMPVIAMIFGTRDMTALNIIVRPAEVNQVTGEITKEAIVIGFGTLVATIIDFILIALVIFLIVKTFNKARAKAEAKKAAEAAAAAAAEEAPAAPTQEELLAEIRDLLKKQ